MFSVWDIASSQLRDLAVYEPGKPIEETARELGMEADEIIKLASNENPLGPSPKALLAAREALRSAHLYPDGGGYYLREALAAGLGCTRENLVLGSGSNEIIEFLGHAFLNRGDDIITSEHAFVVYKLVAAVFGAHTIEVRSSDFRHDLTAIAKAVTPKTRLIFIANPNNPTGTLASQDEINHLVERVPQNVVIVFDEAYYEYLDDPPDTLRFVQENRNVVVLRTFSKIQGLASLRIGYGIAPPELIRVLQKTRQPFNVSGVSQAAALASLADDAHRSKTKRITDEGRAYLQDQFKLMGLRFVPSAANFVLVNVGNGEKIFKKLLERGIIVRALKGYSLPEWVRISIGTMEQNRRCIAGLLEVLKSPLT
ncbi:MAG TPA: histidinol-phosphate transaminase [Chthoniobacterales bacterium]|jgi:histidinol-phosphate aminotransferase|nr:histidinol-phosphate transaminase [Chthoniobacterales bacterium]